MNGSYNDCDIDAATHLHSKWTYLYFGECVANLRQYFAFFIGLSSIILYICAQWPQVVTSCRTGTAHKSLSFWFLLLWLFSDLSNFLGTILTNQLFTQMLAGAYYVLMDLICLLQFVFHYGRHKGFTCKLRKSWGYQRIYIFSLVLLLPAMATLCFPRSIGKSDLQWKSRRLLESDPTYTPPLINFHDSRFMTGYILGCISSVIYFFAVPTQIIKNFRRGSVEGLSTLMFIFVTLGDSTYLTSILLYSTEKAFLVQTLPWTTGSVWSLFFDLVVMLQIVVYRSKAYLKSRKKVEALLDQSATI